MPPFREKAVESMVTNLTMAQRFTRAAADPGQPVVDRNPIAG